MSILTVAWRKLLSLVCGLATCFRRLLCCLGRRRSNIGELPMTVVTDKAALPTFVPQYEARQPSTDWSGEDAWSSQRIGDSVADKISDYRSRVTAERTRSSDSASQQYSPGAAQSDLFAELEPAVIRSNKVVLQSRAPVASSRFSLASGAEGPFIPDTGGELGEIPDEEEAPTSWEEDSLDVSSVLKEAKKAQREERKARLAAEKGAKHHSLAAVKISM